MKNRFGFILSGRQITVNAELAGLVQRIGEAGPGEDICSC